MSVCSPCLAVCHVPLCTDEIILGTITSVSTDVKILIENQSTGRKQFVSTQSDSEGEVTLVTAGLGLMANQTYTISVILTTATALCDTEIITVGTSSGTCLSVMFDNILDNGGCQLAFASQTLAPVTENVQPGSPCICITQAMWDALVASVGADANLVFVAQVLQDGTPNQIPTLNILRNNLGNIVWSYFGAGQYPATLAGQLDASKLAFVITGNTEGDGALFFVDTSATPNSFTLVQYNEDLSVRIDHMNCYLWIFRKP